MVTPFYSDLAALSQPARLAYCFNPFAHVTSLIGGSFEQPRGREVGGSSNGFKLSYHTKKFGMYSLKRSKIYFCFLFFACKNLLASKSNK